MTGALPLSPIDHVFTGIGSYPIEFVFAYPGPLDAERLHASLRRTLQLFPAVSSRLVRLPGEVYGLEPCDEGCAFETAVSATPYAESFSPAAFVAPVETLEGRPLSRVRLTRTRDGSVLGVSISHAVVDGFSYFHFLSAWSLAFHGKAAPSPCHDRGLLAADAATADSFDAEAVRDASGLFLEQKRPATQRDRLTWTRRLFRREELRSLTSEAQASSPVRLSHNDVVAAWLWRSCLPEWLGGGEPRTWLSCPVDVRRLLGLPAGYFGCAVALATASIERAQLASAPLSLLARRVRAAVAAADAARMQRTLVTIEALRRRHGLAVLERIHVVHPRAGLLVTNLSRLPVREIAFDAGPPVAFDMPAFAERCAVILPAEDGLDVRVCAPLPA